jgi:RNA polymerase sigma factor (sigma-70 family)
MPKMEPDSPQPRTTAAAFASTHWSVVLQASDEASPEAAGAREKLCRAYWYPLYAFVRRTGRDPHTAQDLTQEFFARLLQKRILGRADRERGRLRSFLLANLKHFLANEYDREQAQKRGGGQVIFSLDGAAAESIYQREPVSTLTPEKILDQRWAMTVLDRALGRLEEESSDPKHRRQFDLLKGFITSPPGEGGYNEVAGEMKMPAASVAVAVHRLRARFRELVRAEITETVASAAEVDEEMRYLLAALQ